MPWCPQCEEDFPFGPSCPRCRTRLLPSEGRHPAEGGLQPVAPLPKIKVPRRYRRAFDRLSGPRTPPIRGLAIAGACVAFALGFGLGNLGSPAPGQPAVYAIPPIEPIAGSEGSASYLLWGGSEPLATLVASDLFTGEVRSLVRMSPPAGIDAVGESEVVALGSSVAVIVGDDGDHFVAAFSDGSPRGWIAASDVAWVAEDVLLLRSADGGVRRMTCCAGEISFEEVAGTWDDVVQLPAGAALVGSDRLAVVTPAGMRDSIALPAAGEVLAVDRTGARALVETPEGIALWDGSSTLDVEIDGFAPSGAAFEVSGDRVAISGSFDGELTLAVVDASGNVALKPVGSDAEGCAHVPAWDDTGRWIYVATGDGTLHAVESAGGRATAVRTRGAGCGLAWLDSA